MSAVCLSGQGMAHWGYAAFTNTGKPTCWWSVFCSSRFRCWETNLCDKFKESNVCYSILLLQYENMSRQLKRDHHNKRSLYSESSLWSITNVGIFADFWLNNFGYCIIVTGPKETVYSTRSTLWSCQNVESCMQCTNRSNFHHPVLMHILDYWTWKEWWKILSNFFKVFAC